jgi:3-hydroxypropanoate dehydrogenase
MPSPALALTDDMLKLLFHDAHTAHGFTDEPVEEAQIEAIIEAIRWAPTAGNGSPGRFLIVRSAQARERLAAQMSESNRAKTLAAPLTVVTAADTRFHDHLHLLMPDRPNAGARFESDDVKREAAARFSATLQTAYFILAVRAAGLDAGPMGGFDSAGVDAEFFADSHWRSLLVINVGHAAADGHRERAPRLSFEQIARVV